MLGLHIQALFNYNGYAYRMEPAEEKPVELAEEWGESEDVEVFFPNDGSGSGAGSYIHPGIPQNLELLGGYEVTVDQTDDSESNG